MAEPENEIIQLSMRFRAALIKRDEAALSRLVSTYQRLYGRLQDKIDKLVDVIALEEPTKGQLVRMVRYRQLMAQIKGELGQYQAYVKAELEQIGAAGVEAGLTDARNMVQFLANGYGIQAGFNNLPADAVETLLGFLREDGPLYKRLNELAPTTTDKISDALLEGVGLGYGPGKTARDIVRQGLGLALTDALRMTRTVQLWSYREATRASYIANDHIVQGWIWHANLDDRVCMSCVAMHGTEHPVTETLNDHHNGRCAMIPIVPGMDKDFVVPQDGEAWFNDQPEAMQQKLMGKAKFQAWKDGKLQISQLTGIRDDNVYGPMRIEPSYKDIFGEKPVRGVDYDVVKEVQTEQAQELTKIPEFVPAKSESEAISRLENHLNGNYLPEMNKYGGNKSGINFEGLKLDELNSITRGVEGVTSQYNVKFSYIGYQWKRSKNWGTYTRIFRNVDQNSLGIQKTFLNNAIKKIEEQRRIFSLSIKKRKEKLIEYISNPRMSNLAERNQRRLDDLQGCVRWSIDEAPGVDPIEAVTRHEAYHGVYYQNHLEQRWSQALIDYNITDADRLAVSEYGASIITELFPEAATAIDMGVPIPDNVRSAILEVLEHAK